MRIPLTASAWIEHEPAWIARPEADALLEALRHELAWEQREVVLFGRRVLQPRLIAWAGDLGYRYSGQTLEPRALTPAVERLLRPVRERTGVCFNHVLVNRYRDGNDSMGFHADDEPELGEDPVVASLSFGTARRFVLKPRRRHRGECRTLHLGHGSLLVMGGTCQRDYYHGVPRQPGLLGERISLTFRKILAEPGAIGTRPAGTSRPPATGSRGEVKASNDPFHGH
jgi:alkylated DNA repair dioxygenase AlkB